MKKFYSFLKLFFILTLIPFNVNSQINYSDFLPLQTGNVWVYQCSTNGSMCGGCSGRIRIILTGDTTANGKTYKKAQSTSSAISGACQSCGALNLITLFNTRFDSQNGNVYQLSSNGCQYSPGEMMIDSFKARLGDTVRMNCMPPNQWQHYICSDTNNATVLGSSRQARFFNNAGFEGSHHRKYAKSIGLYHARFQGLDGGTYVCTREMILLGCVINGTVFGDTSMLVGINQISGEVPIDFSISQNYPNPFNPVTKIKFSIPISSFVNITIFNVTGSEIETIVNSDLIAGTYEADWNAENYPSGVYYYKLTAGNFSQTKKMVLMK